MKRNKLSWVIILLIFNFLALLPFQAVAEYYLVYSSPDFYDLCSNCQPTHSHHSHKAKKTRHVHYRSHRRTGLYVYYTVMQVCPCNNIWTLEFCSCCPHPNHVRSQWGDYVVFTTKPADRTHGIWEEQESSYNPDFATGDDGYADLLVN